MQFVSFPCSSFHNHSHVFRTRQADLGKPRFESILFEISVCQQECRRFVRELPAWLQSTHVTSPLALLPARSRIDRVPFGVALVISAFNYPLQLSLLPLIAALGAGNAVILKPSELAPQTSALLAQLLPRALDAAAVRVCEGGVEITTALLAQKLDYIFFTGSETVGRVVARAAAEQLTPVTLELGGKSPVYVDKSADIALAARRIAWGKIVNAGQTCIAPDYVLVHRDVAAALTRAIGATWDDMLGAANDAQRSVSFARIVNRRHAQRLAAYLAQGRCEFLGGLYVCTCFGESRLQCCVLSCILRIAYGGRVDVERNFVGPTLLTDVKPDAAIMRDEIFGPVLPVIEVADVDAAINFISRRPTPLALYVFAADAIAESVLARTRSGSACVNDTLMQFSNFNLPFGGIGPSGVGGSYHGQHGFNTFSHARGVVLKSVHLDAPQRYPPYTAAKERLLRKATEVQAVDSGTLGKSAVVAAALPALRALRARL